MGSVRMLLHVLVQHTLDLVIEHQHQRSPGSSQHIGPGALQAAVMHWYLCRGRGTEGSLACRPWRSFKCVQEVGC